MTFEDAVLRCPRGGSSFCDTRLAIACSIVGPRARSSIRQTPAHRPGGNESLSTTTLVVGTALLATTLRVPAGSVGFLVIGSLAAVTWIVGSVASGSVPVGTRGSSRTAVVLRALGLGLVAFLGFLGADFVGQHLPLVSPALAQHPRQGRCGTHMACASGRTGKRVGRRMLLPRGSLQRLGTAPPSRRLHHRLHRRDSCDGKPGSRRRRSRNGHPVLTSAGPHRRDRGTRRDPSLLVNPDAAGASTMTGVGSSDTRTQAE